MYSFFLCRIVVEVVGKFEKEAATGEFIGKIAVCGEILEALRHGEIFFVQEKKTIGDPETKSTNHCGTFSDLIMKKGKSYPTFFEM